MQMNWLNLLVKVVLKPWKMKPNNKVSANTSSCLLLEPITESKLNVVDLSFLSIQLIVWLSFAVTVAASPNFFSREFNGLILAKVDVGKRTTFWYEWK